MDKRDELHQRLLATFRVEAQEHLQAITSGLVALEQAAPAARPELLETVFRAAHSLKGAARAVSQPELEAACHVLENIFAQWQREGPSAAPGAFDAAHRATDSLGALVSPAQAKPRPERVANAPETIRVASAKLDALLLEAEELLAVKQSARDVAGRLAVVRERFNSWKRAWGRLGPALGLAEQAAAASGPADRAAIRALVGFAHWNCEFMGGLAAEVSGVAALARQHHHGASVAVDGLIEETKKVLMRPFFTALEGLPRVVRDLARDLGKEADLITRCGEIAMDRRILQELKDPLLHLLRNCLDHGIEPPGEREQKGKPRRGAITISLEQKGGQSVELVVSDDGAGLEPERLRANAVAKGLLDREQAARLSDTAAEALIFQSGFSTTPRITDVSGRGLGLCIAREKVERLGGGVRVENRPGKGLTFRIWLPTTRATFRGVVVRTDGELFVFPSAYVRRVARVRPADIQGVEGQTSIRLDGRLVALVPLGELLGLEPGAEQPRASDAAMPAVVVASKGTALALLVNEVLNEHEILVKPLGPQLERVRHFEGATALEAGRLAPILHVPDLVRSALAGGRRTGNAAARAGEAPPVRKHILVVEDSILSRALLRNILETADYEVETAVDGAEGLAKLRAGEFDLVVSDIEMPRLDGFELTGRIRADQRLARLPVALVTARETREDRERGVAVGANAYIVKSSFDQSDLLKAIQRLI